MWATLKHLRSDGTTRHEIFEVRCRTSERLRRGPLKCRSVPGAEILDEAIEILHKNDKRIVPQASRDAFTQIVFCDVLPSDNVG